MTDRKAQQPKDMNFEAAMAELEQVVRQLEEGKVPLEDAISAYEKGTALKARCDELLNSARMKVEEIYKEKNGEVKTTPSELESLITDK